MKPTKLLDLRIGRNEVLSVKSTKTSPTEMLVEQNGMIVTYTRKLPNMWHKQSMFGEPDPRQMNTVECNILENLYQSYGEKKKQRDLEGLR